MEHASWFYKGFELTVSELPGDGYFVEIEPAGNDGDPVGTPVFSNRSDALDRARRMIDIVVRARGGH
jgi:hypothetical protein